jgi:mannitol/fructose-specific phosphotransferase system IIA component (Ntr-type)
MSVNLTGRTKETIIDELLAILVKSNNLKNSEEIRKAIFEREMQLSTGLEKGIAIPHVRTSYVNNIYCAIGITREGVDFQSIDGKPAYVIILSLVPSEKPVLYVQFMSTLMQILAVTNLKKLLSMSTENELYSYLVSEYKSQNEKTD